MQNPGVISLLTSCTKQDHSILPTSPCPVPSSTAAGTSVSQILLLRTWNNLGQEFPACFRWKITESTVSRTCGCCQNAENGTIWWGSAGPKKQMCSSFWRHIVPTLHVTKNFWELILDSPQKRLSGWLIWVILSLYRSLLNRIHHWWNPNSQWT